jgi:hypothetical protein
MPVLPSDQEPDWQYAGWPARCPGKLNFVNRIRQAVKQKLFIFLKYHLIQVSRRIACEKITEWYVQKDKQACLGSFSTQVESDVGPVGPRGVVRPSLRFIPKTKIGRITMF